MNVESNARLPRRRHWWSPPPVDAGDPITATRAYLEVLAVFLAFFGAGIVAAVIDLFGRRSATDLGWGDVAPAVVSTVGSTGVAVALVILVSRRRGRTRADLGLSLKGTMSLSTGIRVAAWALLALFVSSIITSILATSGFPFGHQGYPELVYGLLSSVKAGVVEETVVLAFVVVTLAQARRPRWEIVAVALALRVTYHLYYGFGAVGILLWAGIFLWLFFRSRSVVPLIVVHIGWDLFGFLAHRWSGVAAIELLVGVALFITAPILWLVERGDRRSPPPRQFVPPGWYPDPAGSGGSRFWDGRTWTGAVAGPA